jgi:hypothetical protein
VVQAVGLEAYALLFFIGNRVIEANALDEATVATVVGVGNDYVEEGTVFRTTASQTDNYHFESF